MSYGLRLKVKRAERALERLMGVVSRRGYALEYFSAQPSRDQETFDVTLRVESTRKGDVLLRQLQKLNDVAWVETLDTDRSAPSDRARSDPSETKLKTRPPVALGHP